MNQSQAIIEALWEVKFKSIDLAAKYNTLRRLFSGAMPPVGVGPGTVALRAVAKSDPAFRGVDKRAIAVTRMPLTSGPQPITVTFSGATFANKEELDGVFLHELVHVFTLFNGIHDNHGPNFKRIAAAVSKKWGHKVPDEHTILAPATTRGLLLMLKDGLPVGIAMVAAKAFDDQFFVGDLLGWFLSKDASRLRFLLFKTRHPLTARMKVQKSVGSKGIKFSKIKPDDVDDLIDSSVQGTGGFVKELALGDVPPEWLR